MSPRDDLTEVPFLPATERAEAAWLRAREADPSAPAPSVAIAADYAELEELLASLPSIASDDSWQDDVLRAAAALSSRPWWRTTAARSVVGVALAATAAVVVLIVVPRDPALPRVPERPGAPELEVAFRHIRTTRGAPDEHVVGDHLVVTAQPRNVGDLRVYRSDGPLVASCPNGPGCSAGSAGAQAIEITLDAPGQYHVILVDDVSHALPDGAMDVYLEAARAVNARITFHDPIDVH